MKRRRVRVDLTELEADALWAVIRAGEYEFNDSAEGPVRAAFERAKDKLLREMDKES